MTALTTQALDAMPVAIRTQCVAIRQDGERCHGTAIHGDDRCWVHSDLTREKRLAACVNGGKRRAAVVRLGRLLPPRLQDLFDGLTHAMDLVYEDKLDPRKARALADLARAAMAVWSQAEVVELERRLAEMEV